MVPKSPCLGTKLTLLTHCKSKMSYEEYVERIAKSGNRLAIAVKLNDLRHNISRGKANRHDRLVAKHTKAYNYLMQFAHTLPDE